MTVYTSSRQHLRLHAKLPNKEFCFVINNFMKALCSKTVVFNESEFIAKFGSNYFLSFTLNVGVLIVE
jgi:hypothetical protein